MRRKHLFLLSFIVALLASTAAVAFAQDFTVPYELAEPLPGSTDRNITGLSQYLTIAYVSLLSAALGFGLVMLVYSGVQYITAGGNQSAIGDARKRMQRVAYGFLIIVGAVLLLTTLGGDSFLRLNIEIDKEGIGSPGDNETGGDSPNSDNTGDSPN
jgi:hypothetical protein